MSRRLSGHQTIHSVSSLTSAYTTESDSSEIHTPSSSRPTSSDYGLSSEVDYGLPEEAKDLFQPLEVIPLHLRKHSRHAHRDACPSDERRKRDEQAAISALETFFTRRLSAVEVEARTPKPDASRPTAVRSGSLAHLAAYSARARPALDAVHFSTRSLPALPVPIEQERPILPPKSTRRPSSVAVCSTDRPLSSFTPRRLTAPRPKSFMAPSSEEMRGSSVRRFGQEDRPRQYGFV
jgi:hypothetical protein